MLVSPVSRVSSLLVAATLCAAPLPSMAAPGKRGKKAKPAATAEAAEPATDGRTIALMRFTGTEAAAELRVTLQTALIDGGYSVKGVALDPAEATKKVKCKGAPDGDDCLAAVGKWLNANPKTAADFILLGEVDDANRLKLAIFDIAKGTRVTTFDTAFHEGDLIMPIVLPQQLVTDLDQYREPPPPITDDEQEIIAALDEPEKTPEEIAAEQKAIADAEAAAAAAQQDQIIDTDSIDADLKADFESFCRNEPRRKRESKDDPKDLRPACKRGPFWGYWQPRAWVALGLTTGAALGTIALYSAALAGRGPYKDAVDAVDAYNAGVDGDPRTNPYAIATDDQSYDVLATEVSRTGSVVRRRAIVGDVLLGTTVLLTGVLAIIIYQDRTDAKRFIKEEKSLRAISDVRVGPIITKESKGLGLGFRF